MTQTAGDLVDVSPWSVDGGFASPVFVPGPTAISNIIDDAHAIANGVLAGMNWSGDYEVQVDVTWLSTPSIFQLTSFWVGDLGGEYIICSFNNGSAVCDPDKVIVGVSDSLGHTEEAPQTTVTMDAMTRLRFRKVGGSFEVFINDVSVLVTAAVVPPVTGGNQVRLQFADVITEQKVHVQRLAVIPL